MSSETKKKQCINIYYSYKFYCKVVRETMLHMYNIDENKSDTKLLWKYFNELKVIWAKAKTCALQREKYMQECVSEEKRDINHLKEIELAKAFASKTDCILSKIIAHIKTLEQTTSPKTDLRMPSNIYEAISREIPDEKIIENAEALSSGTSVPNIGKLSIETKDTNKSDDDALIKHIQSSKQMYMNIGEYIQRKMKCLLKDPSYADQIDPADVADIFIDMFFLDPDNSEAKDLNDLYQHITKDSYQETLKKFCIRCIDCVLLYNKFCTLKAFIARICEKYDAGADRIDYIMNILLFYLLVLEGEDDKAKLIVRLNSCNPNGASMEVLDRIFEQIKGTIKLKTKYLMLSLFTNTMPSIFEHNLDSKEKYYMSLLVFQKEVAKPKSCNNLTHKVKIFSKIHDGFFDKFYEPVTGSLNYEKKSLAIICKNTVFLPDFFIHAKLFVNTTLTFIQKHSNI